MHEASFFDAVLARFGLRPWSTPDAQKTAPRFGPRFTYDGRPFDPETWTRQVTQQADTSELARYAIIYRSPDHGLELHLQLMVHHDFPVIEWQSGLRALGDTPTAIVADFQSLALDYPLPPISGHYPNRQIALRRNLGSKNQQDDFAPAPAILRARPPMNHVRMETDEGRSSAAWLPFFGVDFAPDEGLNFGIGWSGAWKADVDLAPDSLSLAAGMMRTRFRLFPGETIRQPSIFVQVRSRQTIAQGQNQLRQFILKHHSPRDGAGRLIPVPHPISGWGGRPARELAMLLDDAAEWLGWTDLIEAENERRRESGLPVIGDRAGVIIPST